MTYTFEQLTNLISDNLQYIAEDAQKAQGSVTAQDVKDFFSTATEAQDPNTAPQNKWHVIENDDKAVENVLAEVKSYL